MIQSLRGRELRFAGLLISVGLLIEATTLLFNHPLAFVGFILLSGGFTVLGMLLVLRLAFSSRPTRGPAASTSSES